jgi:hypothetical protein
MLKKLDDIVQRILVQKATPDWLPFVPGSSFWVPPRRSPLGVSDFVGKLADKLSYEESLSVATDRGWPCSHFLIDGIFVSCNYWFITSNFTCPFLLVENFPCLGSFCLCNPQLRFNLNALISIPEVASERFTDFCRKKL